MFTSSLSLPLLFLTKKKEPKNSTAATAATAAAFPWNIQSCSFFFSVSAGVGGVKVKKKNKERREKKTGKKSVACDTHTATWLRIHSFIARRCRRIYLILEELPSFFLKFFFSVTPWKALSFLTVSVAKVLSLLSFVEKWRVSRSRFQGPGRNEHTHKKKERSKVLLVFCYFFKICVLKFHSSLLSLGIKAANAKKNTQHGNGNHLNWFRRLFRYSFFFCWCCRRVVFFKGGGQVLLSVGVYQVHHM